MGECIITRAAGEPEAALPLSPGYHTIGVTLRDPYGKLLADFPLVCNDGSQSYNYKTNEKGQTIFMVNSGAANICLNNNIYGYQMLDFNSGWTNIDAPVGLSTRVNINMNLGTNFYEFTSSKAFGFLNPQNDCEIILVGGGGSGGSGDWYSDEDGSEMRPGSGGAAGNLSQYNNQALSQMTLYKFIVGSGGSAVNGFSYAKNGITGGTSYIQNTNYSAIGGTGGVWYELRYSAKPYGGLGNGAVSGPNTKATNSPVSFAGGGGGGALYANVMNGGWPYGGKGAANDSVNGGSGSRGGGGGGGYNWHRYSGAGGAGLMRINIHYE